LHKPHAARRERAAGPSASAREFVAERRPDLFREAVALGSSVACSTLGPAGARDRLAAEVEGRALELLARALGGPGA
jgi:hypothetical protein